MSLKKLQRQFVMQVQGATQTHIFSSPLTLDFETTLASWQSIDEGYFSLYNLSQSSRTDIYQDWNDQALSINGYRRISLWAGYLSWVPESRQNLSPIQNKGFYPLIFTGHIRSAYSSRQGPNWITQIEAWDGGYESNQSEVSASLAKNATFLQRANYLASQIPGISIGWIDPSLGQGSAYSKFISRGVSYSGSAMSQLQIIADAVGAQVNISLGKLYMAATGTTVPESILPVSFNTISSETGLINTPIRQKFFITVEMLFEPRIVPLQKIALVSEDVENNFAPGTAVASAGSQQYKVAGISHSGIISDGAAGDLITTPVLWYGGANGI